MQFFSFFIQSIFDFYLMNAPVYVDIYQGIHKGKLKVAQNEKRKKLSGFSFSINIANFEVFCRTKKLISNLFFLKSVYVQNQRSRAGKLIVFFKYSQFYPRIQFYQKHDVYLWGSSCQQSILIFKKCVKNESTLQQFYRMMKSSAENI